MPLLGAADGVTLVLDDDETVTGTSCTTASEATWVVVTVVEDVVGEELWTVSDEDGAQASVAVVVVGTLVQEVVVVVASGAG